MEKVKRYFCGWQVGWWFFGALPDECCFGATTVADWRTALRRSEVKVLYGSNAGEQYGKKLRIGQNTSSVTPFPGNFFRIRLFWILNFFPGPGSVSRLMHHRDSSMENTLWFFRLPIGIHEFRLSTTSLRCGPIEQKGYFVSLISQLHSKRPWLQSPLHPLDGLGNWQGAS